MILDNLILGKLGLLGEGSDQSNGLKGERSPQARAGAPHKRANNAGPKRQELMIMPTRQRR